MNQDYQLFHGDCLEVMDRLIEKGIKVDCVITDPPYGTTSCKWDSVIPFDEMWKRLDLLIKPNGAITLFGSEPFSSQLRVSNLKHYKYDWVWKKAKPTGFSHSKNMPLKDFENIMVFSKGSIGHKNLLGEKRMIYNPQGLVECERKIKRTTKGFEGTMERKSQVNEYIGKLTGFPKMVIEFSNVLFDTKHPTQKPVDLLEYLIRTYTNENDLILDFTMGSGSTGVACLNTNRKFIGIELDDNYFNIAKMRIEDTYRKGENNGKESL